METLRTARTIAQVVFTWFVLTVCAASLAPLMHGAPPSPQPHGAHEGHHAGHAAEAADHEARSESLPAPHSAGHGMECPLCLVSAPPPLVVLGNLSHAAPAHRVETLATRMEPRRLAAAPLPARGPPSIS